MAKSRRTRKRKELLLDQDLIRMAIRRFNVVGRTGFRSMRSLAAEFDRDPAVVSKAILRAFQDGLVEVRPSDTPTYHRISHLERAIESKYSRVRAVVVNVGEAAGDGGIDQLRLSRRLGSVAGDVLFSSAMFRDGDFVGVGNGATLYFFANAFERLARVDSLPQTDPTASHRLDRTHTERSPLPVGNLSLVATTGRYYPSDPAGRLRSNLDSDFIANLLAPCFSGGTPMTLGSSLCDGEIPWSDRRESGPLKTVLPKLTHLFTGLGVVNEKHRFDELRSSVGSTDVFRTVAPKLDELLKLVEANSDADSGYVPVAEVCCNLFLVEPDRLVPSEVLKIRRLLDTIQRLLLTIPLAEMRKVPTTIVIAGGPEKGVALRHFLSLPDWRARQLFTDEVTALQILGTTPAPVSRAPDRKRVRGN